jgi:predicted nucleotidyltransferase
MIDESIKQEIILRLSSKNPYKVILFGSHAWGTVCKDSDVDLLIVLNKDGMPQSYLEKSSNYIEISNALRKINKKIPMDIVVMTKAQWKKFIEMRSGFSKEILEKGISLL